MLLSVTETQPVIIIYGFSHYSPSVSLHDSETKMNSANLALVFGPTLTRAPDNADTRLLHNDVPSINALIQMCIEHYEYIYGEDSEEEEGRLASPPPPPIPLESSFLGTSPVDVSTFRCDDDSPPLTEEREDGGATEDDDEVCELPEPPPPPPSPPIDEPTEPLLISEHIEPSNQISDEVKELTPPPVNELELPVINEAVIDEQITQPLNEEPPPVAMQPETTPTDKEPTEEVPSPPSFSEELPLTNDEKPPAVDGLSTQVSTSSVNREMSFLNQALQDIESSIEEMKERPNSRGGSDVVIPTVVEEDEDDDSEESDTEG